jgi:NADH-quinone oxidoreductase subunit M
MDRLRLPWLELAILFPLLGAVWVKIDRNAGRIRSRGLIASGLALICTLGAWLDFLLRNTSLDPEGRGLLVGLWDTKLLIIDELSAPLLPLGALIVFLTILATPPAKSRKFSFSRCLISEAILLATLSCDVPWGVIALLVLGTLPPYFELARGGKPTRVYATHMGLFIALLVAGQSLLSWLGLSSPLTLPAILLLTVAVLLRSGIVPVHCWMTDLFEHATFGTALLTVAPMVGAYGVIRLVLPIAPQWVLEAISLVSLFTAFYAAGMALVQQEARRFFCYLFLSHSSLVLVGLETATPIGLTGALSVWISVGLALTGFGLTLRCIESRTGRVSLTDFHGLYPHVPILGAFFLVTGLASIGFPGTIGFVGLELLVEGTSQAQPLEGAAVVVVAALNGLAVLHAYFRIFTGKTHTSSINLRARASERASALVLTALILGGGLYPQPGIISRYDAARHLASERTRRGLDDEDPQRGEVQSSDHPAGSDPVKRRIITTQRVKPTPGKSAVVHPTED